MLEAVRYHIFMIARVLNNREGRPTADLFAPIAVGHLRLQNRIFMAPMTRGRARYDGVPISSMVEYYSRRAAAGLILTEAVAVSPMARGWCNAPSIYTNEQVEAWREVTRGVSRSGGRIFAQLWYVGRVSHPDFLDGRTPLAPSAIRPDQELHTPLGKKPCVRPREMDIDDIRQAVQEYATAGRRAIEAGFDGVQIHAANGYLPDQFLRDGSNRRVDAYGGSAKNRARFLCETIEAIADGIGMGRVAVRLSPRNAYNDMQDRDPMTTFATVAEALADFDLAFLEVVEPLPGHFMAADGEPVLPAMRMAFPGVVVVNGGYTRALGDEAIAANSTDAVSFGVPFLSNPDFVERVRTNAPLNAPDFNTFYTPGEPGYLDYPTLEESGGKALGEYRILSLDEAKRH
jgi:N-ethylmaleimide reductase